MNLSHRFKVLYFVSLLDFNMCFQGSFKQIKSVASLKIQIMCDRQVWCQKIAQVAIAWMQPL